MESSPVPLMGELSPTQFRQHLAGLIDPQSQQTEAEREELKVLAILFAATLPVVFGGELDRLTMWDRIGTALQTASAKTANADCEFFIQCVLDHIKASPSQASHNEDLARLMSTMGQKSASDRVAWIRIFSTHLVPILVFARRQWQERKQERKGGT